MSAPDFVSTQVCAIMCVLSTQNCLFINCVHPSLGTLVECLYTMATFGIPTQTIPLTYAGELKVGTNIKWIERRQALEEERVSNAETRPRTDLPGKYDVMIGRGIFVNQNNGNDLLRMLVHQHMDEYRQAPKRGDKSAIATKVITMTLERGGRFLKEDEFGWWSPVSNTDEPLRKVMSMFRNEMNKVPSHLTKEAAVERSSAKRPKVSNGLFSACCTPGAEDEVGFLRMQFSK